MLNIKALKDFRRNSRIFLDDEIWGIDVFQPTSIFTPLKRLLCLDSKTFYV